MFCRNCGNQLDPSSVICIKCGSSTGLGMNFCQNCGRGTDPNAVVCVGCGAALQRGNGFFSGAQKSKMAAGILGLLVGYLGIHNFYLGFTNRAILQIVLTLCTCGLAGIWGFVEGILILMGSISYDANGLPLSD